MSLIRLAFVPTNVSGVNFYRIWQFVDAMNKLSGIEAVVVLDNPKAEWYRGHQFFMHPWENDFCKDELLADNIAHDLNNVCAWADAIVWGGLHTTPTLKLFLEMKSIHYRKKFLTEMDDFIFSIPQYNQASDFFKPGQQLSRIFFEQIKYSDAMIVSTPYLRDLYGNFGIKAHVVENAIDTTLWRKKQSSQGRQRVNLGWMGGGTHTEDLEIVKDVIFDILEKFPGVRFKCLHGVPEFFKKHPRIDWTIEFLPIRKYPMWVCRHKFDVGIAPLVDNNFNRGKSNLRWLEMSAMGIPCVASPLPHFKESIRHGETGFIASMPIEWKEQLSLLIRDESARKIIGKNAQDEVKAKWSPSILGRKYKSVIEEILNNASSHQATATESGRGSNQRSEQYGVVSR